MSVTSVEERNASAAGGARGMVMVVDDDPVVCRSVSRLLRAAGYEVSAFTSPQEFLGRALPAGPSCVVLDVSMDGMTGLEVQERLGEGQRRVPVLFLSGHGTIPTAVAGFKHGARDFLENRCGRRNFWRPWTPRSRAIAATPPNGRSWRRSAGRRTSRRPAGDGALSGFWRRARCGDVAVTRSDGSRT